MFKKDDIVVCISDKYYITEEGDIYSLSYDQIENQVRGKTGVYNGHIEASDVRFATPNEILAYKRGIRNIKDIKELNYEIY